MAARPRYLELLRVLSQHQVDFIVVGGVAAILEGAPISTLDLDVVYDRSSENLGRLAVALEAVHARYRDPAGRRIVPNIERLASFKLSLLLTDLGPLDVLATIGDGLAYPDLLAFSKPRDIHELAIRVLDLGKLIELKEHANRDKDRAVLPVLRRTLELRNT